jgi:hypothetical protein
MGKGLRTTLWILSSLAVLWTMIAVICLAGMAGTMGGRMMRPEGMEGTMSDYSPFALQRTQKLNSLKVPCDLGQWSFQTLPCRCYALSQAARSWERRAS